MLQEINRGIGNGEEIGEGCASLGRISSASFPYALPQQQQSTHHHPIKQLVQSHYNAFVYTKQNMK
ncbi:hypothetical protein OUZ56_002070 [Daphnia magna]|uniref:Uncharacterized protein n=1 Tax=Daphnia magna TaxID=35525 RepID=A0ABR0A4K5_9CRUS|nr:hypothetical protein OUZ56_002070 [Daphnia magna]